MSWGFFFRNLILETNFILLKQSFRLYLWKLYKNRTKKVFFSLYNDDLKRAVLPIWGFLNYPSNFQFSLFLANPSRYICRNFSKSHTKNWFLRTLQRRPQNTVLPIWGFFICFLKLTALETCNFYSFLSDLHALPSGSLLKMTPKTEFF